MTERVATGRLDDSSLASGFLDGLLNDGFMHVMSVLFAGLGMSVIPGSRERPLPTEREREGFGNRTLCAVGSKVGSDPVPFEQRGQQREGIAVDDQTKDNEEEAARGGHRLLIAADSLE